MIIFDSCILRGCGLESSSADLLRAIRGSGVGVAAPWMVVEELAAQHVAKYLTQHKAAAEAFDLLRGATPWSMESTLEACAPEEVRDYWRKKYTDFVGAIPTSETVLREALIREASGLPPAKVEKQGKVGGRDAAIWLSAVEYAKNNPEETVFFVSSNTRDFGDGAEYDYPMAEDVEGLGDRFVHLTSLNQVIERFTRQADVDPAAVQNILQDETWRRQLGEQLKSLMDDTAAAGFEATLVRGQSPQWTWLRSWLVPPGVRVESIGDVKAFAIGDEVWCTATAQILAGGVNGGDAFTGLTFCRLSVPVLVSMQDGRVPVALRIASATPITEEDMPEAVEQLGAMAANMTLTELDLLKLHTRKAVAGDA
ncbi:PIN domain-containing protein [Streptomyces hydrogenans]